MMLVALLAGGCSAPAAAPPVSAGPSPSIMVAVTTDVAWTQLVLALDERILTVLDLTPTHSRDAGVIALSADIAAQHRSEIELLRGNLFAMGAKDDNPHAEHEMPGMVTATTFAELKQANGSSFDQLLSASLRAHLTQCVSLAQSELKAGTHAATRALAAAVQESRERDLSRLPG
ncbi:DUF305 domain-containing protein [Rhizocola hellebori]|uniref:DUF305 domain-containing protein n=2 Tax=Rhizocola hellebori TaxID=1392758 RepID=A0A8J3Q1F0_9ACTN|nr:DUF305 domain-containing protein [Rhizocola hellebori]